MRKLYKMPLQTWCPPELRVIGVPKFRQVQPMLSANLIFMKLRRIK